jgi:acetolactate synthase-1/2/3 large subunit
MILAGGGVVRAGASEELLSFARRLDAPVACTLMGLGAFPGSDPLYTGMIGMHGSRASNIAAQSCDLLIAVGSRFPTG